MIEIPHLVVTDSGFGGLALCARLEAALALRAARITYVNACPADELGYNDMECVAQKIATFADVLATIEHRFDPQRIVVACNTLASLLDLGVPAPSRPIASIVDVGARLLGDALLERPTARALVLSTATTAAARPFDRPLAARGVDPKRIEYRACPGLQSVITADPEGARTAAALAPIAEASALHDGDLLVLGCTHYSLASSHFARAFAGARLIDPVSPLADELLGDLDGPAGALTVRFVSRYRPPARELDGIVRRLAAIAPTCAAAVADLEVDAGLFAIAPASPR